MWKITLSEIVIIWMGINRCMRRRRTFCALHFLVLLRDTEKHSWPCSNTSVQLYCKSQYIVLRFQVVWLRQCATKKYFHNEILICQIFDYVSKQFYISTNYTTQRSERCYIPAKITTTSFYVYFRFISWLFRFLHLKPWNKMSLHTKIFSRGTLRESWHWKCWYWRFSSLQSYFRLNNMLNQRDLTSYSMITLPFTGWLSNENNIGNGQR